MAYPAPFIAAYHGACVDCGRDIGPNDLVCGDGEGGYLCEDCAHGGGLLCDC